MTTPVGLNVAEPTARPGRDCVTLVMAAGVPPGACGTARAIGTLICDGLVPGADRRRGRSHRRTRRRDAVDRRIGRGVEADDSHDPGWGDVEGRLPRSLGSDHPVPLLVTQSTHGME